MGIIFIELSESYPKFIQIYAISRRSTKNKYFGYAE